MINEFEVPACIIGTLPQLKNELIRPQHVYASIRVLTDYTKRMALEHQSGPQIELRRNCFVTFLLVRNLRLARLGRRPIINHLARGSKFQIIPWPNSEIKKCMSLVEKIYHKGNALVKNAVENIFIFSFSSMRIRADHRSAGRRPIIGFFRSGLLLYKSLNEKCNIVEWRIVQSYMPTDLYAIYMQQVLRSKD